MNTRTSSTLIIILVIIAAMGGIIFTNHTALARQADAWGLLPRPERATELYFNDFSQLAAIVPARPHAVIFSIANDQCQTTIYHYSITAALPSSPSATPLASGDVRILDGQTDTLSPAVTVPPLGPRIGITVHL